MCAGLHKKMSKDGERCRGKQGLSGYIKNGSPAKMLGQENTASLME